MDTISWSIRQKINQLSRRLLKNELLRKRCVVALNNGVALKNKLLKRGSSSRFVNLEGNETFENTFFINENYRANGFYGTAGILRTYSGYEKKLPVCIEHGLYLGDYVNKVEGNDSGLSGIVTFGPDRRRALELSGARNILEIGPYIQYAQSDIHFKNEVSSYLNVGKTLLLMPGHSTDSIGTEYDYDDLISHIDGLVQEYGFSNVIINLYFRDCNSRAVEAYRKAGYLVTCCGHMNDPKFLSRQRALIELSDVAASNSFGTYIGYCISLGVPFWSINSGVSRQGKTENDASFTMIKSVESIMLEIMKRFPAGMEAIGNGQRLVCEQYWGLGIKRSKTELYSFFQQAEKYQYLKLQSGD